MCDVGHWLQDETSARFPGGPSSCVQDEFTRLHCSVTFHTGQPSPRNDTGLGPVRAVGIKPLWTPACGVCVNVSSRVSEGSAQQRGGCATGTVFTFLRTCPRSPGRLCPLLSPPPPCRAPLLRPTPALGASGCVAAVPLGVRCCHSVVFISPVRSDVEHFTRAHLPSTNSLHTSLCIQCLFPNRFC